MRTESLTYTTAHSNARSLTHWARPGVEPGSSLDTSWICFHCTTMGSPRRCGFDSWFWHLLSLSYNVRQAMLPVWLSISLSGNNIGPVFLTKLLEESNEEIYVRVFCLLIHTAHIHFHWAFLPFVKRWMFEVLWLNFVKKLSNGSSCGGAAVMNTTGMHMDVGLIPGLTQWVKDLVLPWACGVGHRRGSDPVLLWLWCRPAAVALIWPQAWEPPYAVSAALKRQKQIIKKLSNDSCSSILTAFAINSYSDSICVERI